MTRQKKEILKKIEEIDNFIGVDMALGCGFAPTGFYDPLYEEIHGLEEQLAKLRHYSSRDEMLHDLRDSYQWEDDLPFK